ncbi:MAG: phytoene desaturase family protein [Candidatus Cryptobacteroides sp.]
MRGRRAIIIGSGLGGLECGYILAKKGMEVTVLERQRHIGGCLQSFHRRSGVFDTGMHYVGSLGEGESLGCLFRYFGLMDLPWKELDRDCFDEVIIGDESFAFANGHAEFAARLAERFPREKEGIGRYVELLKETGDNIFGFLYPDRWTSLSESLFGRQAYGFLCECIQDPLLRKVLSGTSLKMELNSGTLPLYTFAQINDSFIRSAWRLGGSGSMIADTLADNIRKMGGRVLPLKEVTEIREDDSGVTGVRTSSGEFFEADWVISDAHPAVTVSLTSPEGKMRKSFRNRFTSAPNTSGMFTACFSLKKDTIPYLNRNQFIFNEDAEPWSPQEGPVSRLMVSYPVPETALCAEDCVASGKSVIFADKLDILTPCPWDEVREWEGTQVGRRGDDYVRFKQKKIRNCLKLAERHIPGIADAVNEVYTSTPLTYWSYNLSPEGSAYGLRKDFHSPLLSRLSPQTPVEGLLMTGQSLNLHGVLGVSMTSLLTCGAILGMDAVREELRPYILG